MSLCTLIQRVGQVARKFDVEATGVYLVEKEHFDVYKVAQAAKKKSGREEEMKSARRTKCEEAQDNRYC